MLLALILAATVTALLCWLLFTLAALALPLLVGTIAAQATWRAGCGLLATLIVGLIVASLTLFAGQLLVANLRTAAGRRIVLLVFIGPAAIAGFSAAHGLAAIGTTSVVWQNLLGVVGSGCVALASMARLRSAMLDPTATDPNASPMIAHQ